MPFLTCKHSLEYCLRYAERAYEYGFRTLVVLGGDRSDGIPRCVEHACELRREIRRRVPEMQLGGWANPHSNPAQQVEYLAREEETADFFLTQVVSHHSADAVARFLEEYERRCIRNPPSSACSTNAAPGNRLWSSYGNSFTYLSPACEPSSNWKS